MTQTLSTSLGWLRIRKKDGSTSGGSKRELTKTGSKPTERTGSTSSRIRNLVSIRGSDNAPKITFKHGTTTSTTSSSKSTIKSRSRGHKAGSVSADSNGTSASESTSGSRRKDLFFFETAVATRDELGLEQIDEEGMSKHVSLVWSKDMLTSMQRKFYKAQGLSSKHLPSQVYLSDRHVACDRAMLDRMNVEYIVNCTHSTPCLFEEEINEDNMDRFRYHRVPLSDDSSENLLRHLPDAVAFMNNLRSTETFQSKTRVVLVHCSFGISRSASVVVGWMMSTLGMPVLEALRLVCGRRAVAKPQPIFLRQLLELESDLFGKHNVSLKERDLEPCIVCLEESFTMPKEELTCGHVCCVSCFAGGIQQCTLCIYTSKLGKSSRRRS